jgi:hypothetical protein
VYPDRDWVVYVDETFSREGHRLGYCHRDPGGSEWSMIFRYDDCGRILEKVETGERPDEQQRFSYDYDPAGRLTQVMLHSPAGDERVFESVKYDTDGTRVSTQYPTPVDEDQRSTTSVDIEHMLHGSIDTVAVMTVFDTNNRAVRKVLYDVDDRVIRRIGFRYDARGLLLEEGELIGGSFMDDLRKVYRYDSSGRVIELESRWIDQGGSRRTMAYNERGDLAEEVVTQRAWLVWGETGSSQKFDYRYDDHDNWIERTTRTISTSGEDRVSMIEQRELTYYNL